MISQSLWPHQRQALDELADAINRGHRRICLTSPTGGGKTRMGCDWIINSQKPTVWYTHRRMLLSQTGDRFEDAGIRAGYRASGLKASLLNDVQIAMIQSEAAAVRSGKRAYHNAEHVLIDEAHNNKASQAEQILDWHEQDGAVRIGLTATPLGIGHLYDHLIVAGTNSELRECGSHVLAYHYGPDEPSTKLVGKVAIDGGECGIAEKKRMIYAQRVFGSVVEHFKKYNPICAPTILFAPGLKESIWFAKSLCEQGINAAHIDGKNCWLDGEEVDSTQEVRDHIAAGSESGRYKVVCNRFVLREGVDWPWIAHGVFATVFGSLTSYLQAGGRIIRAHSSMDRVTIQDHGGNWWRHGSLNSNREWDLDYNDRIMAGIRQEKIRNNDEPEPIHCPKCQSIRLRGPVCYSCGFRHEKTTRPVLQADGSLKEMAIKELKARRTIEHSQQAEKDWIGQVIGTRKSKKKSMETRTFAQLRAAYAERHNWQWPTGFPMMPIEAADWFRAVKDVPAERLTR